MWTYLRSIRPDHWTPAELVDGIGDEDHRYRCSPGIGWARGCRGHGCFVHNGHDYEAKGHDESSNPKGRLPSPHLREEQEVNGDSDKLLSAKKSRDEQRLAGVVADNSLEELRPKVRERGHTRALLGQEHEKAESEPVAICGLKELALFEALGGPQLFF